MSLSTAVAECSAARKSYVKTMQVCLLEICDVLETRDYSPTQRINFISVRLYEYIALYSES